MTALVELQQTLKASGQSHLLQFREQLPAQELTALLQQIESIDFRKMNLLIEQALQKQPGNQTETLKIEPLKKVRRLPVTPEDQLQWTEAEAVGNSLLNTGRVGAILVAGGQGSRLGFPHPKGMFPIGPVTDRTLFQIFFEQLLALSNRHGVRIPYFIMTSDATHAETEQFLQEHAWFGYPADDVFLFRQGTLPAVDDRNGQILLSAPGEIAMSPDGHGGLLLALQKAGLLDEMEQRGIDYLYYHQVDNPCARLCDPVMLGLHVQEQVEVSTKVVAKREAAEKVGILAQVNGKQGIIEYSDLPAELSTAVDAEGKLLYWAGNIAIHVFNRALLQRLSDAETGLPVHIAHKKVAFLNEQSQLQEPEAPNAFKFEHFIFDAIPMAKSALVIETSREEEFNPVKNAEGNDSPESSRQALLQRALRWFQQAGQTLPKTIRVEISPLIALEPDDLKALDTELLLTEGELLLVPDAD